ncbi:MAG: ImmA/IrrE family metallo-endopeptidase [Oscillospiraceae bacterium]|nr:ImmA/IrrE family metallo-endopeptidase [Oscillospiraceae bacterium]
MLNYGVYKDARNASWNFLLDYHISNLPVNLSPILSELRIEVRIDKAGILDASQKGCTIADERNTYIIVRKGSTTAEIRYTIAHELGHIYLGHLMHNGKYYRTFGINSESEYQAERFAIGILAPACILWGLDLHTPEDIAKACNISITAAHIRAERMATLYKRGKFLTSPLERKVFQQFFPENKKKPSSLLNGKK